MCFFAIAFGFHRILFHAYLLKGDLNQQRIFDPDSSDEDDHVAVAIDEIRAFRRLDSKRANRALKFLVDTLTQTRLIIWLAVCSPMMHLHYHLFSRCAHLGGLVGSDVLFRLANPAKSLAVAKLSLLFRSLVSNSIAFYEIWGLVNQSQGGRHPTEWPQRVLKLAHISIVSIMGSLWRRFIYIFTTYPLCLVMMADPLTPSGIVAEIAMALLDASECCLDWHFALKLRRLFPALDDLVSDASISLLRTCFSRALPTTTHIENAFANMRVHMVMGVRALRERNVFSRHVLKKLLRAWYDALHEPDEDREQPVAHSKAPRPIWMKTKRQRVGTGGLHVSGYNVFSGEQLTQRGNAGYGGLDASQLGSDWQHLSAVDRRPYQERAKGRRALARSRLAMEDPLMQYDADAEAPALDPVPPLPHGLGDRDSPVSIEILDEFNMTKTAVPRFCEAATDNNCILTNGAIVFFSANVCVCFARFPLHLMHII